jgi:uncharacterized protein
VASCGIAPIGLTGRVVDAAQIIDAAAEDGITRKLAALEKTTGRQLVVVSLPSLGGNEIADVSLCLGNRWGVGREAEDDGVLLVVAPNERQVRIEVGLGLEAALTDGEAMRALDTAVLPAFGEGRYAEGIRAGVDAIAREVS